jgi:hypothetical protein
MSRKTPTRPSARIVDAPMGAAMFKAWRREARHRGYADSAAGDDALRERRPASPGRRRCGTVRRRLLRCLKLLVHRPPGQRTGARRMNMDTSPKKSGGRPRWCRASRLLIKAGGHRAFGGRPLTPRHRQSLPDREQISP